MSIKTEFFYFSGVAFLPIFVSSTIQNRACESVTVRQGEIKKSATLALAVRAANAVTPSHMEFCKHPETMI